MCEVCASWSSWAHQARPSSAVEFKTHAAMDDHGHKGQGRIPKLGRNPLIRISHMMIYINLTAREFIIPWVTGSFVLDLGIHIARGCWVLFDISQILWLTSSAQDVMVMDWYCLRRWFPGCTCVHPPVTKPYLQPTPPTPPPPPPSWPQTSQVLVWPAIYGVCEAGHV